MHSTRSWLATAGLAATLAFGQNPEPTWELGRSPIDPESMRGVVEIEEGVLRLNGTGAFDIPRKFLGDLRDFTIDFELRIAPEFAPLARSRGALMVLSNTDAGRNTGFSLRYNPPGFGGGADNRFDLGLNAYPSGRVAGLGRQTEEFMRFTIVSKDASLMIFRNGTLWTITGEVNPSELPLTIGAVLPEALPISYELRGLKLYDTALPPSEPGDAADVMITVSGEGYTIQRARIEDPSLPRILVVGDSISGGYRRFITEHFQGRAYVDYWVGGGWFDWTVKEDDFPLLRAWDGVFSHGPYDVVSWNSMTLHMWGDRQPSRCVPERYPAQMRRVVDHLRRVAPDTRFIWVRCTPYTKTVDGKFEIDPVKSERLVMFNNLTDEVMNEVGLPMVDLYSLCERHPELAGSDGVHWSNEGYRKMAEKIIETIESKLAKP